jgi:hypothetical protein
MSFGCYVENPLSEADEFYIPFAGETTFYQELLPIIKQLRLELLTLCQVGLDIDKDIWSEVLMELNTLKNFLATRGNVSLEYVIKRIDFMQEKIGAIFERYDNAIIFLG